MNARNIILIFIFSLLVFIIFGCIFCEGIILPWLCNIRIWQLLVLFFINDKNSYGLRLGNDYYLLKYLSRFYYILRLIL